MTPTDIALTDIDAYLKRHQEKELLRLVVVGSVDDGKSTLIGRLLHDTHGVYEDQLSAVKKASSQAGMAIDFSLFTDGLKAEREQGITIDVAYRYFSTEKRKFIIADTPGHVQYTRNMATGASTANVAVTLIDARLGVLTQSRRHAYIASLLGIPHLAVAVNKMDLAESTREVFERICREFGAFASKLGFKDVRFIPVSALRGDNIVERSTKMPWYTGQTILEYLEQVPIAGDRNLENFRYPVQYVIRPHLDYRGFAAEIASGTVARGDRVLVLPSRKQTTIASIDTFEGPLQQASAPMSVTLTLGDEVDVSRGDMLVHPEDVPHVEQRFEAMLVWMNERELNLEESYFIKHTTQLVRAEFESVQSRTNLESLEDEPTRTLGLNDIGRVVVRSRRPLYFDPYVDNHRTGAFIVVDPLSNATVAAGMIRGPVADTDGARPAVARVGSRVPPAERWRALGQRGAVVQLTGPPASGKSEVAFAVERLLHARGRFSLVIDPADSISVASAATARQPGEVPAAALELCERGAAVGWITLLAFAAPDADGRARARQRAGTSRYVEVYLQPSADARAWAHEPPSSPDLVATVASDGAEAVAQQVVHCLERLGVFDP
jgi:sulfate adenylyltransferase large subunit